MCGRKIVETDYICFLSFSFSSFLTGGTLGEAGWREMGIVTHMTILKIWFIHNEDFTKKTSSEASRTSIFWWATQKNANTFQVSHFGIEKSIQLGDFHEIFSGIGRCQLRPRAAKVISCYFARWEFSRMLQSSPGWHRVGHLQKPSFNSILVSGQVLHLKFLTNLKVDSNTNVPLTTTTSTTLQSEAKKRIRNPPSKIGKDFGKMRFFPLAFPS